jgi:protein-disulfide isomerase
MGATTATRPTKRERREALRAARIAAEQGERTHTTRRRRLIVLGAAAVLVTAAVAVLLVTGGREQPARAGASPAGVPEVTAMLDGIPQDGLALGRPDAPVTLVEFADLQCPFCRDFAQQTLPLIVRDYVRTGNVRIEFQPLTFIGPDSVTAAELAAGAAAQDRLWHFTDLFYFNQGAENTGYATDELLDRLLARVPGLDPAAAHESASEPAAAKLLADAEALAARHAVSSTPTLLLGRTSSTAREPVEDPMDYEALRQRIGQALRG